MIEMLNSPLKQEERSSLNRLKRTLGFRRGQEEIAGFVVIVLVVMVAGVLLLSLTLRSNSSSRESARLDHFLESALEYTTSCTLDGLNYLRIDDLLGACYKGRTCSDGTSACIALNDTLGGLISQTLDVGPQRPFEHAHLEAVYSLSLLDENQARTRFYSMSTGNCTGKELRGSSQSRPFEKGFISMRLSLCT